MTVPRIAFAIADILGPCARPRSVIVERAGTMGYYRGRAEWRRAERGSPRVSCALIPLFLYLKRCFSGCWVVCLPVNSSSTLSRWEISGLLFFFRFVFFSFLFSLFLYLGGFAFASISVRSLPAVSGKVTSFPWNRGAKGIVAT